MIPPGRRSTSISFGICGVGHNPDAADPPALWRMWRKVRMSGDGDSTIEHVLARLDGVKRSGAGHVARCPAHQDREQSLSVAAAEAGKVLLDGFARCTVEMGG